MASAMNATISNTILLPVSRLFYADLLSPTCPVGRRGCCIRKPIGNITRTPFADRTRAVRCFYNTGRAKSKPYSAGFIMAVNDGGARFVARLNEIAASTETLLDQLLGRDPALQERARPARLLDAMRYATLG